MTFTRAPWAEALPHLRRALRGADAAIGAEVASGSAEVWRVDHDDGVNPSWLVTRIEGTELVAVAFEGSKVRELTAHLVAHARARGFSSIRFHAATPALARMVRAFGPELVEYVSRIRIDGR